MKDWIEQPDKFIEYPINYQNKEYSTIAEMLFGLIIQEFVERVTKEYIIDHVVVHIPTRDYQAVERMKTSLKSIGLK